MSLARSYAVLSIRDKWARRSTEPGGADAHQMTVLRAHRSLYGLAGLYNLHRLA